MTDATPPTACPRCGVAPPADAPDGLCPACLFAAIARDAASEASTAAPPGHQAGILPDPAAPRLHAGQCFGPFRIGRLLGRGGMGEVYEAEHLEQGRRVAIKLLNRRLATPSDRARFLREGELAASVTHPHIVYIFGAEEIAGTPVIVMELLAGGTLKDLVERDGPLAPADAVDAVLQLVDGLDAAHAAGILHRDIKPSNGFVDPDGSVKIGDFGLSISTLARHGAALAVSGGFEGTPQFAAPEQIRGEALDVRADIYAVGATLYYLLTGRPPFEADDLTALLDRAVHEPAAFPPAIGRRVPRGLAAIVLTCLAKDRAARPASYAALADHLRPYRRHAPTPATMGRRLLAFAVDYLLVCWPIAVLPNASVGVRQSVGFGLGVSGLVALLAYFAAADGLWGVTLGKRVFGLRVVSMTGQPVGIWRAVARGLIVMLPTLAWLVYRAGPGGGGLLVSSWPPASFLYAGLLFAFARRRNGLAGLHDLLTGTRVVEWSTARTRPDRVERIVAPSSDAMPPARYGPYDIVGLVGETDVGQVLAGFDPRLRRRVWIHALRPDQTQRPLPRDVGRSGRLRWLNGRRDADGAWDAFESADGQPFVHVVAKPHPWSVVKHYLVDVARELDAAVRDDTMPPLALDRLWITDHGRVKILDFRAPGLTPADAGGVGEPCPSVPRLLAKVADAALTGSGHDNTRAPRTRPLPVAARRLLDSLAHAEVEPSAQLVARIERLVAAPDHVTRGQRLVALAVSGVQVLGLGLGPPLPLVFARAGVATRDISLSHQLAIVVLFGLLSAAVCRGGLLLGLAGMTVVDGQGRPVSRLRAAWRALVAWSPLAVLAAYSAAVAPARVPSVSTMAAVAVLTLGGLWAVAYPARGIQDRLAGTWLVPK